MQSSWKIGTAFGIGIYLHWTFALLPALAFAQGYSEGGSGQAFLRFFLLLAVCGCVVLHELGHALMARTFHIGTRDITLYPIGGVARLERMTTRPVEELLIALAGPAVNVVLILLLAPILLGTFGLGFSPKGAAGEFLLFLLGSNVLLVLFNLIPAFPMDGGRVFRALLSLAVDYVRATEIAFYVGIVVFACFFCVLSVVTIKSAGSAGTQLPMLALIGVFVVLAGRQELNMVRRREALRHAEPIDALPVEPEASFSQGSVASGFSGCTWDHQIQALVKWHNGRPVGTYPLPSE
jgi:Zn-dependent protease